MRVRSTYRPKIGPFRINTGRRGVSSISTKVGPFTLRLWSRTKQGGVSSVNLPGPLVAEPTGRRRSRRTR